ncbi:MAG: T9SS type A sorting domain-containing protein [Saprospiraceae bacterium]|nr:T9SS type A sorting domain-containing protein [Saprospiraceae bacterium]
MKKLFLLLTLVFNFILATISFGQKNDFKWLLGYSTWNPIDTNWGITIIDFDTPDGNPVFRYDSAKKIQFAITSAIISDDDGEYLFSCNGSYIEDSSGHLMQNGDQLSDGARKYNDIGEVALQGALILPYPCDKSKYILFHTLESSLPDYGITNPEYFYSIVELSSNYPKGKVIHKRKSFLRDTLAENVSAVKHANGRDWWIVISEGNHIGYYVYLLSDKGLELMSKQTFEGFRGNGGFGLSFFSNDGKYFATAVSAGSSLALAWNYLYFFTFDRCTGKLGDLTYKRFPYQPTWGTGCSFSTDSKLLYVATADTIYQFEISGNELKNQRKIAGYDGYVELVAPPNSGYLTEFGMLQLAPNGKIYGMLPLGSYRSLDVINNPNLIGKDCDFKPHSAWSPTVKTAIPSFPNFRLGPIDGSSCDTLGINNVPWCWWSYNQDTSDYLNFEFTDLSAYEVEQWCWDFGDPASGNTNTSMEKNPMHEFSTNGVYTVCLIVKNKNGADTLCRTIKIGNVVSTENQKLEVEINVFPNPCKDYLVVNVLEYNPEKMLLNLSNQLGQIVLAQKLYQGSNVIGMKEYEKGVYFLSIQEQNSLLKKEIIIKN